METESPDIICITETWLTNEFPDVFLDLNDFVIFRKDRDSGNDAHGGVLIAVNSNLNPSAIAIETDLEVCFINLNISGLTFKLGVVYRPQSFNRNNNQSLYNIIRNQIWNADRFCVLGDFNFPYISWNTLTSSVSEEKHFIELVHELNMIQHVSDNTRGNNILDLCFSPNDDSVSNVGVKSNFSTSDHSYITLDISLPVRIEQPRRTYRDFNDVDYELLNAHLATIDWDIHFNGYDNDCNVLYTIFQSIIDDLIDQYVPIKVFSRRNVPWFTPALKRFVRTKQRKYNKYKNNPNNRNFTEYKNYCKFVKSKITSCKINFEKRKFMRKNTDSKKFFKYINSRTKRSHPVANLIHNNRTVTFDSEKADILQQQYCSVFTRDNGILPDCPQRVTDTDTLCNIVLSDRDIINAIRLLNSNSCPGPDGIHPKFFNNIYSYLVKPLKRIFNLSLSTGVVPQSWKISEVIPIYKNNRKPNNPASYRPVSLTSYISKIFEKIVHTKVVAHLNNCNIITKSQHGFLSRKSTTTNLLECLNDWTTMLDEKSAKIDIMYIDLEKAFDSLTHEKLLFMLSTVGIGGNLLTWFSNFLTGRFFNVKVGNVRSDYASVNSGVPQGTILGPLLFILFINNVSARLSNSQIQLYADDSKLYSRADSIEQCQLFERDISALYHWFTSWQLKINFGKCEILHLGYNSLGYQYTINDHLIPPKEFCRDLGVCVDNRLSFHRHCLNIARNAHYKAKLFFRTFTCHDHDFCLFLYKTYIRPLVESGTQVWSPHSLQDIDTIESVQRRFTKRLPGLFNYSYIARLEQLQLKTLEERRIANDLMFLFKMIHGQVDVDFNKYFSFNSNNFNTRGHSLKLNVNYSRLDCRRHFFCNRVINIWNGLPESIISLRRFDRFKIAINDYDLSIHCKGRAFNV